MSKTAASGDMQGDHIKGTINADVRYMWPIKFMVGYLVLSEKCCIIKIWRLALNVSRKEVVKATDTFSVCSFNRRG